MSAKIDRIEGRDVFGHAIELDADLPKDWHERGAVVAINVEPLMLPLDAPSALRLGAFLLARGLGAADASVKAGTLVLVAPEGAGPLDVLDVAERARAAHAGPVVVVPFGWTAAEGVEPKVEAEELRQLRELEAENKNLRDHVAALAHDQARAMVRGALPSEELGAAIETAIGAELWGHVPEWPDAGAVAKRIRPKVLRAILAFFASALAR